MSSQRTGGGYAKWQVVDGVSRQVVSYELTKREAVTTAMKMNTDIRITGHYFVRRTPAGGPK